jgi:hypothetical protein
MEQNTSRDEKWDVENYIAFGRNRKLCWRVEEEFQPSPRLTEEAELDRWNERHCKKNRTERTTTHFEGGEREGCRTNQQSIKTNRHLWKQLQYIDNDHVGGYWSVGRLRSARTRILSRHPIHKSQNQKSRSISTGDERALWLDNQP